MKRSYNSDEKEPDQKEFKLPSEKEHLFQVVDIYTANDNPFKKGLPDDIVAVKCEVVGGDEDGRTLLQRLSLDDTWKGFFATRLFLKAIGEEYKGQFEIETDRWIGRQFYATVCHSDGYANIDKYNFEKRIEQVVIEHNKRVEGEPLAWDEN